MGHVDSTSVPAQYQRQCDDHGVKANSSVLKQLGAPCEAIQSLELAHALVGNKGVVPLLKTLSALPNLASVNLSHNGIRNSGASVLADAGLQHPSLTHIDLSHNHISLGGALALTNMLRKNYRVVLLELGGNRLDEYNTNQIRTLLASNRVHTVTGGAYWHAQNEDSRVRADKCHGNNHKSKYFVDKRFVADVSSLFVNRMHPRPDWPITRKWCRPDSLCKDGAFLLWDGDGSKLEPHNCVGKPSPFHDAMMAVARKEGALARLFVDKKIDVGLFSVKLFLRNEWEEVVVDDLFPCKEEGEPIFCRPVVSTRGFGRPMLIWPMVLEKAAAKAFGSYEALMNVDYTSAIVLLTGCIVQVVDISKASNAGYKAMQEGALGELTRDGNIVTARRIIDDASKKEEVEACGIVDERQYPVLKTERVGSWNLVCLAYPPGVQSRWTGRWSDSDKENWTAEMRQRLNRPLGYHSTFWMCIDDFLSQFFNITVLQEFTDGLLSRRAIGRFSEIQVVNAQIDTNVDRLQNKRTYRPKTATLQYSLSSKTDAVVFVELQVLARSQAQAVLESPSEITIPTPSVHVMRSSPNCVRKVVVGKGDIAGKSVGNKSYSCTAEVFLEGMKPYTVCIDVDVPEKYPMYLLRTVSQEELMLAAAENSRVASVNGAWTLETAGGCPNFESWDTNPHVFLSIDCDSNATIHLRQDLQLVHGMDEPAAFPVGFLVFKAGGSRTMDERLSPEDVVADSNFVAGGEAVVDVALNCKQNYIVVPSTFNPHCLASWTLDVYTRVDCGSSLQIVA